jgi:hypothetical protein
LCGGAGRAGGHSEIALCAEQGHGFYHHPGYREKTNVRILKFLRDLQG